MTLSTQTPVLGKIELETSDDPAMPLLPLELLVRAYRKMDRDETADRLEAEFGSKRG